MLCQLTPKSSVRKKAAVAAENLTNRSGNRGYGSSKKASEECTAIYNQQTLDNIREELEYYTYYEAIPIVARVIDP